MPAAMAAAPGVDPVTRALEGPIDPADYEGAHGCPVPNHGLARFRDARFEAAYPLGQVLLSDPDVPVTVRLQAFNPLLTKAGLASWVAIGMVGTTALIAVMIRLTLRGARPTAVQAATGFFYLAVITAFAGELAAKVRFLPST